MLADDDRKGEVFLRVVIRPELTNESEFWEPSANLVSWEVLDHLKGVDLGGYQVSEVWGYRPEEVQVD